MKRLTIVCIGALFTLAAGPDAFGWGAVSGPPIAVRWAGRPSAPLPARQPFARLPAQPRLAARTEEPPSVVPFTAGPPCIAARLSSPRALATASRLVRRQVLRSEPGPVR